MDALLVFVLALALTATSTCMAAGAQAPASIIFGSHHKAGSTLMQRIASTIAKCEQDIDLDLDGRSKNVYHHQSWPRATVRLLLRGRLKLPFVHVVRDPADMIVSSYLYHLTTKEKWALL